MQRSRTPGTSLLICGLLLTAVTSLGRDGTAWADASPEGGAPKPSASVPAVPLRVLPLRGIAALSIAVEGTVPKSPQDSVTADQIWKDAALRLRIGGVRVLETPEERAASPGTPVLTVAVNVIPGSSEEQSPLVYSVMVELRQRCTLAHAPDLATMATTWRTSALYRGGNLREGLRNAVRDLADDFLNDFLAANPPTGPNAGNPAATLLR